MSAPHDPPPQADARGLSSRISDLEALLHFEEVAPGSSLKIIEADLRAQIEHENLDRISLRYDKQIRNLTVILQFAQYTLSTVLAGFFFYKEIVWPAYIIILIPVLSSLITVLYARYTLRRDDIGLGGR